MRKERSTVARTTVPGAQAALPLAQQALAAIRQSTRVQLDEQTILIEERNVWQPDSWLIRRCWETLANAGAGSEALQVARLLELRQPLAPLHALYRIVQQQAHNADMVPLLQHELERWHTRLFHTSVDTTAAASPLYIDQLLVVAAAAALLGAEAIVLPCLERIDQAPKAWARLIAHPEQREQVAIALAYTSASPLTTYLITGAIRRFDDAGTQLLHAVTTRLQQVITSQQATADQTRLFAQCVETVRYATLVNLPSRRLAAMILGQAGLVEEVLTQITTIQSVLSAQRSTGYNSSKDDGSILRQVKRTTADRDVDFLVYTLCKAIEAMPLRQLEREQRIVLADQLALWGAGSDGWTASSAAATLIDLGAIKYAITVVDQIPPTDPARSEGMLTLVRGLLKMNEPELAAEQAERALTWARSQTGRNPERALTWGLAEIYLQHDEPQAALRLLERWREPTGWRHTLRTFWRERLDDDGLHNSSLRFQALLKAYQQGTQARPGLTSARAKEIQNLFRKLQKWAPRLLEGEALIHFYVDSLLRPLLAANQQPQVLALLPDLRAALITTGGNKHAVRVTEVATLLAAQIVGIADAPVPPAADDAVSLPAQADMQPHLEAFLSELWQSSAHRGTWQIIHTIEGSLPLLLACAGPDALVTIAQSIPSAVPATPA